MALSELHSGGKSCIAGSPPVRITLSQSNRVTASMSWPSDISSHSSNSVSHHGHRRLHRPNRMNTDASPVWKPSPCILWKISTIGYTCSRPESVGSRTILSLIDQLH